MSPSHNISSKTLKAFLEKVKWDKVAEKAPNVTQGQRIFPAQVHDSKLNFRIDKGKNVDGKFELILQPNNNAENPKVKQAAQNNSHQILASTLLDTENDKSGDEARKQLMSDFKRRT